MNDEIEQYASFLGVSPEELIDNFGLIKADKQGSTKRPGYVVPLRGALESQMGMYSPTGVKQGFFYIQDNILREVERKNAIVGIVTNTRCMQMVEFARPQSDPDKPGFRIKLRDEEKNPNNAEKKEMAELEEWFCMTGRTDFEGSEEREDNILDMMKQAVRDYLTIDKIAVELRRDRGGRIVDFWMLDPATIKRVIQGGYRGQKTDFDPRVYMFNDEFMEKLTEAKLKIIPPLEKIAFVQEIDGRLVAAFSREDLIFDVMSRRTDVRYKGWGYAPAEQAMNMITGFLYAIAFNNEAFNGAAIPKLAIAFEQGDYTQAQLQELSDEWLANFQGVMGQWRMPFFTGKVQAIDLMKSNREMEYQKYLEFTASLIGAIYGFDLMESGLKFFSTTNALSENADARQQFSKDRGLKSLLGQLAKVNNMILKKMGLSDRYVFDYTGLEPKDREFEQKLRQERVKSYMTVDEIRAEADLEPLPDGKGDLILDSIYMQNIQAQQMAEQGGGFGDEGEEGFGEEEGAGEEEFGAEHVDEAMDEVMDEAGLEKAAKHIKARTLLM